MKISAHTVLMPVIHKKNKISKKYNYLFSAPLSELIFSNLDVM
jgi:hypothetical protein